MKTNLPALLALATALAIETGAGTIEAAAAGVSRYYTLFWKQRTDVGSPGPRYGHALAYDSDRGVTVFFGGEYSEVGGDPEYFNDTWEYDGFSWKKITIDGPVPDPRSRHAMCYDNALRQVILFGGKGGFFNDVWNYEPTGPQRGRWIHRSMALGPGPRYAHTMVFDYFAGRAIVAGGTPVTFPAGHPQTAETWEWNNSTGQWFLRSQTVGFNGGNNLGAGLTDHMMLYDYRRRETVVEGGVGPFGTELVASTRLYFISGPRSGREPCGKAVTEGAIVYDGFHDIYFQFGGNGDPGYENIRYPGVEGFPCGFSSADTTVSLTYGPSTIRPGQRAQCAMVYDEKRRVTVMFGGVGGTRYGDTWELVTRDSRETWVHFNHVGRELGTFEFPYNTLAEGLASVTAGGILRIKTGSTPESPQLNKAMTIEAFGGPVTIGRP